MQDDVCCLSMLLNVDVCLSLYPCIILQGRSVMFCFSGGNEFGRVRAIPKW